MENNETDKLSRTILKNSKLELSNPNFTLNLMNKIKAENRRKFIVRQIASYFLLFISIDALILASLKLLGISITELSLSIENMTSEITTASSGIGNALVLYLLLQTFIFLLIAGRAHFRNSASH